MQVAVEVEVTAEGVRNHDDYQPDAVFLPRPLLQHLCAQDRQIVQEVPVSPEQRPWRFDEALTHSEDSSTVNTSFIERLNLTIRQSSAYLSRRTLSHARATHTLDAHLELLRCYYNFVRPHRALRFGRETRTPAMQAGLATRRLTLRHIFVSVRRVVWWLSDVLAFADLRRTAAAAVMYMPVAA